jgi:hypothetical protein
MLSVIVGINCGGGGPTSPDATTTGRAGGIPVLAHFVTWHNSGVKNWGDAPSLPVRRDAPEGGYSSRNRDIIALQNAEMQSVGIIPMASWWGPTSYAGDEFLNVYLTVPGPHLALLYEAVGPGRPGPSALEPVDFTNAATVGQFVGEMEYLRDKYFNGPSGGRFLRIDGKPVVFIWITNSFRGPFAQVSARVRPFVYLVGSEFTVPAVIAKEHEEVIRGLDAVTAYGFYDTDRFPEDMDDRFLGAFATAVRAWRGKLAAISPDIKLIPPMTFAYDERGIPGRSGYMFGSDAEHATRYAQIVRSFVTDPGPGILPFAYMTSYNEHYEGSGVEHTENTCGYPTAPAPPDCRPDYLGIIRNVFASPGP